MAVQGQFGRGDFADCTIEGILSSLKTEFLGQNQKDDAEAFDL